MKNFITAAIFATTIIAFTSGPAVAEPTTTSLQDYSFDFATMGYNVQFSGKIKNFSEPLENGDYVLLRESGYSVMVSFDALSRNGKRQITEYFNANCIVGFGEDGCSTVVTGEVQLNDEMQVLVVARKVILDKIYK